MNRPFAPQVSVNRKFPATLESDGLPVLGARPGLRAPLWQRLAVAAIGFASVAGAILLAR